MADNQTILNPPDVAEINSKVAAKKPVIFSFGLSKFCGRSG